MRIHLQELITTDFRFSKINFSCPFVGKFYHEKDKKSPALRAGLFCLCPLLNWVRTNWLMTYLS